MIEVTIKCDECGKAGTASLSIIRHFRQEEVRRYAVERTVLTAPGWRGSAHQHMRGGSLYHRAHICPDCIANRGGGPPAATIPYSVEMEP